MSDLIERLRDRYSKHTQELRDEAADALEAKDKEIERLRGDIQILKLQRDASHVSRCPKCSFKSEWQGHGTAPLAESDDE